MVNPGRPDPPPRQSSRKGAGDSLQVPPSQSALSVRSEDDGDNTGYITASSSRLSNLTTSSSRISNLDSEPVTGLPRYDPDMIGSLTPTKSPDLSKSSSLDSIQSVDGEGLPSLSSVTTFVPSTIDALAASDEDDEADDDQDADEEADADLPFSDREAGASHGMQAEIDKYDFDLRDESERTFNRTVRQHEADDSFEHTLREGDFLTISHSHSTSLAAYTDSSAPPTRSATPHNDKHPVASFFPVSLSSTWPALNLPPSAVKLHRRRRNLLLRLLKTWEGREQILHLTHSIVLILYSTLDHPMPQTYSGALLRPAGTVLAMSFPKPVRVALMQRIYTTAEGIDNFRRVILIARWITAATERVMDHYQHRQTRRKALQAHMSRHELQEKLTGEGPTDKPSDHVEEGMAWLQPPNLAPFDAEGAEEPLAKSLNPARKIGKLTGRGDAKGAVGAEAAENADAPLHKQVDQGRAESTLGRLARRFWASLWRHSHLEVAAESLATVGEACETAAVLAGGGMFWRAVGIQRLGLPLLSRRRRQGVERMGIVLSLCSVLLSLLVLRMERRGLRSELRSAHRRIIRANDKLGWASDLSGRGIERDLALSLRKRDPSKTRGVSQEKVPVELLGQDLQAAARDLDDCSSSSDSLSSSDSNLSDTWTVVPDAEDKHPHPTSRPVHSSHHYNPRSDSADQTFQPHRRHGRDSNAPAATSLVKSTERSLLRAESDLKKTRRRLHLNSLYKLANYAESVFLTYEAAAPHVDKEGVEGWSTFLASGIRLSAFWRELSWG